MTREQLQAAEAKINRGKEILRLLSLLADAKAKDLERFFSEAQGARGVMRLTGDFTLEAEIFSVGIAARIAALERELDGLTVASIVAVCPQAVSTEPAAWLAPQHELDELGGETFLSATLRDESHVEATA